MAGDFSKIKIDVNEIIGQRFGRLTVIEFIKTEWDRYRFKHLYKCQCDCGNIIIANRKDLIAGSKLSCGCLKADLNRIKAANNTIHGMHGTRFYYIWQGMHSRCRNPNNPEFKNYGGRGITIDFWWFTYLNFQKDMYESYLEHCEEFGESETTLDRKDTNGPYSKYNCRWATRIEQANNTTRNILIEYNGSKYTARELLDNFPHHPSVYPYLAYGRIINQNWSVDEALNIPLGAKGPFKYNFIYNNKEYNIRELYNEFCEPGLTMSILHNRLLVSPMYRDCLNGNIIINPRIFSSEGLRYPIEK